MRVTLLTLAILVGMEADLQVLLLFLGLMPAAGAVFFVCMMLAPAARARPQSDTRPWRGTHRTPPTKGRHSPARGSRLRGLSRQAQLEERTVHIDPRALRQDIARVFDVPEYLLRETTEAWQAQEAHEHEPWRDGVRLRCRTCRLDLDQPEGMPEVGKGGMWSWDGSTLLGPRPVRPKHRPPTPPVSGA